MDQVAQVREKIDVVALIGEYVAVKKAGRNFKANCPFHNEKTPSFVISPERQMWHCFGCQKGGDAFTFLMEYEHLEFPEALRMLAKKAGITLESTFDSTTTTKKELYYKLNHIAADFYHYILTKHPAGKRALTYLTEERKISPKVIETFLLGFAPGRGDPLVAYLTKKKGFKPDDIVDAGLASFRYGRASDFFFNRLMFPLFDHRDNIIGFSGRMIDATLTGGKYVNTRETLVYHKGDGFFGFNVTKQEIRTAQHAIVMEGEFDVMSSFQAGVGNVVAVKGTALTENQVHLLARFVQKISLCFDVDKAGIDAMKRSVAVLEKQGLSVMVITPPGGKDPDEAIKHDEYAFKKSVKEEVGIYDFLLENALKNNDPKTAEGKKQISQDLLPLLAQIENEVVKEHYMRKLSDALSTSYESIAKQIEKIGKNQPQQFLTQKPKEKQTREETLEQYLLALIVQAKDPGKIVAEMEKMLEDFALQIPIYQKIIDALVSYFTQNPTFDAKKFVLQLPAELIPAYDTAYLFPLHDFEDQESYEKEAIKIANDLRIAYLKKRIKDLGEAIKVAEKEGNEENGERLREEFSHLTGLLKQ